MALLLLAPSVGAQQVAPEAQGFNAPTLEGDWRFRLALNGWIPDSIPVSVSVGNKRGSTTITLDDYLNRVRYYVPLDGEARKGTFGIYLHTLTFKLVDTVDTRRGGISLDTHGSLIDVGLSYELGSWDLGVGAPVLTVEPFAGARLLYNPTSIDVDLARVSRSTTVNGDTNYVPDIGIRTFWELTEHWNLHIEGDYGGFGVDDNHQTWQVVGLIGYRFPGWGVHWNLQAGYRAMRLFDLRRDGIEVKVDARGPDVIFGIEF